MLPVDWSKLPNPGKTVYTYAARDAVESQLPKAVKDAMAACGWDALGVYELVKFTLREEKRIARRSPQRGRAPNT